MKPTVIPKRLSPQKAADLLGRSREFVVRLIQAGELPATDERGPGSKMPRFQIDPADCERWVASRQYVAMVPAPVPMVQIPPDSFLLQMRAARIAGKKKASR